MMVSVQLKAAAMAALRNEHKHATRTRPSLDVFWTPGWKLERSSEVPIDVYDVAFRTGGGLAWKVG